MDISCVPNSQFRSCIWTANANSYFPSLRKDSGCFAGYPKIHYTSVKTGFFFLWEWKAAIECVQYVSLLTSHNSLHLTSRSLKLHVFNYFFKCFIKFRMNKYLLFSFRDPHFSWSNQCLMETICSTFIITLNTWFYLEMCDIMDVKWVENCNLHTLRVAKRVIEDND